MVKKAGEPCTLYSKGRILGFKRSKVNQYVNNKVDTDFYMGKRVVYVYRAKKVTNGSKYRAIWGKVTKAHGNNGVVRCNFKHNLPASAIAGPCRVMLYPSRI